MPALIVSETYLSCSVPETSNLRRLANFRTDHFPLVRLVFFDGVEEGLALESINQ
jgi:hypothetical protein